MKSKQYLMKCPERIRFGDPMYFERFSAEELSTLVVDYSPPAGFEARVVLSESEAEDLPGYMDRSLTIYMAPGHTIDTYVKGYKFDFQKQRDKQVGVDTARYLLEVDGIYKLLHTGGDGYWGNLIELSHDQNGKEVLDAVIITACIPEFMNFPDIERLVPYFLQDVRLLPGHDEKIDPQMNWNNME